MTGARITALGTAAGAVGTLGLGAFVARRLLFPTPYTATATVRSATDTEVELTATATPAAGHLRPAARRHPGAGRPITTASTATGAGSDGDTVRRSVTVPVATGAWAWDALRYDGPDAVPGTEPEAATTHVVHVHGQSLGPRQVLRGVGVWRALGASSEVVDTTDLPLRSLDAGAADRIVAAVRAARARGSQRVVLQAGPPVRSPASVAAARVDVDGLVAVSPCSTSPRTPRGRPRRAPARVRRHRRRPHRDHDVLSRLAGAPTPVTTTTWQDSSTPTLLIHSEADALVAADDVAVAARRAPPRSRSARHRTRSSGTRTRSAGSAPSATSPHSCPDAA